MLPQIRQQLTADDQEGLAIDHELSGAAVAAQLGERGAGGLADRFILCHGQTTSWVDSPKWVWRVSVRTSPVGKSAKDPIGVRAVGKVSEVHVGD
jgi:hypothetical protein